MANAAKPTDIASLEPKAVWRIFAEIAAVPRPSKREEKIRAHMRRLAEKLGFSVREDAAGNMVVEVAASRGHEHAPVTVLQGHLDMVCEKNAGTQHDFEKEGIRVVVEEDARTGQQIVRGEGTTLGADNGIGVAMAFAAASSPDVIHGPLEILLTVDEEMGMTGAGALQPGFFKGRRLLNLDSEDDQVVYIGCAGGGDITLTWEFDTEPLPAGCELVRVSVSGLRGGHSGGDIHENRGNANKVLARALMAAKLDDLRIVTISGGSKRNAIAREAGALLAGASGTQVALQKAAAQAQEAVAQESGEPDAVVRVERGSPEPGARAPSGADRRALSAADTRRLLWALTALPHGVLEMHQKMPGLVQTSNNVATVTGEPVNGQTKLRVIVGNLSRSSVAGRLAATRDQIAAIGHLAGAAVELGHSYPGWDPNPDSPLLATCRRVYEQVFGGSPRVAAIHAGLECGIIGERMGNLDMVSFGPRITGAHSPDERTYVASVQKSYRFLTAVLAELTQS